MLDLFIFLNIYHQLILDYIMDRKILTVVIVLSLIYVKGFG
jgi:uncharacterized membrane protein (DUF373 family)